MEKQPSSYSCVWFFTPNHFITLCHRQKKLLPCKLTIATQYGSENWKKVRLYFLFYVYFLLVHFLLPPLLWG